MNKHAVTAMLRELSGAMRSWCEMLEASSRVRDLTKAEETILYNANLLYADGVRALRGEDVEDQDSKVAVYVEQLTDHAMSSGYMDSLMED